MQERRRLQTKQMPKVNLPWSRGKQICATQNAVNPHGRIIDYDGQLIGKYAIRTPDDKIAADLSQCLPLRSIHRVRKLRHFIGNPQTKGRLAPLCPELRRNLTVQSFTAARIGNFPIAGMRRGCRGTQFRPGTKARIHE